MKTRFKIQRVVGNKESRMSWPHWFRLADLEALRQEVDEAMAVKRQTGDCNWPWVWHVRTFER